MQPAINLQTKEGLTFYYQLQDKYEWSKENDQMKWFHDFMLFDGVKKERELIHWSEEIKLDANSPPNIWYEWKVKADEVACMNYFAGRK